MREPPNETAGEPGVRTESEMPCPEGHRLALCLFLNVVTLNFMIHSAPVRETPRKNRSAKGLSFLLQAIRTQSIRVVKLFIGFRWAVLVPSNDPETGGFVKGEKVFGEEEEDYD
jgi:hypothetical protein